MSRKTDNNTNGNKIELKEGLKGSNQSTLVPNNNLDQVKNISSLNTQLFSNLKDNRSALENLKLELNNFKSLLKNNEDKSKDKLSEISRSLKCSDSLDKDIELINNQDTNFTKTDILIEKYQIRVDELEAQLLDQDELIQEHEKSTQTLMASFRTRCATLLQESQQLRKKYEKNLLDEKSINNQLIQENCKLRSLLHKLTKTFKEGILEPLDEDELAYEQELSRLDYENKSLRSLLKISDNGST